MLRAPTVLTLVLSAAAVAGYLTYRALTTGTSSEPTAARSPADAAPPSALAARLPDFTLEDLEGGPLSIRSWPDKPLLINFWATWCAPCLREIPMLKEFQAANPDLQVVGIAVDRREPVVQFAADMQFNYAIMVGDSAGWEAAAAFGVDFFALPFTVFSGADGSLLGVHTGELHAEHLDGFRAVLDDLAAGRLDTAGARTRMAGSQ